MDYTTNYHLPQWVKEDRIMMDDFNRMSANLEEGLTKAQGTADSAQETAETARQEAAEMPYVVGLYIGTGSTEWNEINLGFPPRFVIITQQQTTDSYNNTSNRTLVLSATNPTSAWKLTENGFAVSGYNQYVYPWINSKNGEYTYIAFR